MRFYYDSIYWIILIPVLLRSLYAQIQVSSSFRRYSRERTRPMRSSRPTVSMTWTSGPAVGS